MPFQDLHDLQPQTPRQARLLENIVRKVFLEDVTLKLLALAITFFLWFAVTGQKRPITKRLSSVQLSFSYPEQMEISNEPVDKVDVIVTGSSDELDKINPVSLVATVAINDGATGDRVIRLARDRVKLN